ncbi:MAG: hypothetical protein AVO35_05765 [Candidatus Aegiribacteria sp. MLS_C]|nr:MAG: hypothetical protein AVO35_05765 [Candidatus Aegiribacteria sp. MLS_C]
MRSRTGYPAGTPCDRRVLAGIYRRQFEEIRQMRRNVYSLLPLRSTGTVFEPGCGTGLLATELRDLTGARYTGMDIDPDVLPDGEGFIQGDAIAGPVKADMYVSSFFFSIVPDPVEWLARVGRVLTPGGFYAVMGEYDYDALEATPDDGFSVRLLQGLRESGLYTGHGGRLDAYFSASGFTKLHGGEVLSSPSVPDRDFLAMNLAELPEKLPYIKWRIVWGIWRNRGER